MSNKPLVPDFRPQRTGLKQVLGDLEADIMEYVWKNGQVTVRAVYEHLLTSRGLAYTTVMTVMSRLAEKELLIREQEGGAYVYQPAMAKEVYLQQVVAEVLDALFEQHSNLAVSHWQLGSKTIRRS